MIKSRLPASGDDCVVREKGCLNVPYKHEVKWPYVIKGTWTERVERDIARV